MKQKIREGPDMYCRVHTCLQYISNRSTITNIKISSEKVSMDPVRLLEKSRRPLNGIVMEPHTEVSLLSYLLS